MIEFFYALMLSATGFLIFLESVYSALGKRRLFSLVDSITNAVLYLGFFAINLVWAHVVFALYAELQSHAIVSLTLGVWHLGLNGLWWEWVLLIVLEDLCFYSFHRASHRVRFFWASHVTHHSSQFYNLSVALRQTWIPFPSVLFWLPLPLLGFDPLMIMSVQVASLFYQEFLHTQLIPPLGPLEWIFNTPQHHAIHHGSNPSYIDKNYGGVLIVWDRFFGTFASKSEPVRFGLTKNIQSNDPITATFHGWVELFRDFVREKSWRTFLGPPK